MTARKLTSLVRGAVFAGVITLLGVTHVSAAASTAATGSGSGLKVSPVTTNLTIDAGQSATVQVFVQNVTQGTVNLQVLINDFIASNNETGQPALLLEPGQYAPSHSLKRFITPISDVTLASGEQKTINVVITIPKNAPGGGYYGAIRFAPSTTGGGSNVTLSASVGSLILVRVPGNYKEQLVLDSIDIRNGADGTAQTVFTSGNGLVVAARFENKGDVQEQPFGKALLEQGGKVLGTYEINNTTPRGNVLPDSIRKFTINLDKVGFIGQYTVVGNFGYGTNGQLLSASTTFYVVPIGAIVGAILLIALILFFIFGFPRLVRSYNARVLRSASRR